MRKIIVGIFFTALFFACSQSTEKKLVFVYDFENILNEQQEKELTILLNSHEKKTSNEIVILTTPDWGNNENILFYTQEFWDEYKVGKKDKDNGVVITFSKQNSEVRIATGYGTEKVLMDSTAKRIIDKTMIPKFIEGQYYEGLLLGTIEVINYLELPGNEIK